MKGWIVVAVVVLAARIAVAAGPAPIADLRAQAEAAVAARDFPHAFKLFQKAAERGDIVAQYRLANALFNGGVVRKNAALAEQWYQRSAEKGYAPSQTMVGRLLLLKKDYAGAARWFGIAANQGHAQAQVFLGFCYLYGRGVSKDPSRGVRLIRLAAAAGDVDAKRSLAILEKGSSKPMSRKVKFAVTAILLAVAGGAGLALAFKRRAR